MGERKRIVCLANSRKLSGRCVAGIEIEDTRRVGWIRPVSDGPDKEVSEYDRQYRDGSDPKVLDVIEVPLIAPQPSGYQQENWVLDPDNYWEKVDRMPWGDLFQLQEPAADLWINGSSTNNGLNDSIPLAVASGLKTSLRFIRVDRLALVVSNPGAAFGNPKRRVQGHFEYNGTRYWLWVTDPRYEREYLARPDGSYEVGECYLTISLAEPYMGSAYKLIAAIIERAKES